MMEGGICLLDQDKIKQPDNSMPTGSPAPMRVPNNTDPLPKPNKGKIINPRPSDSSIPSQKE